MNRTAESRTLDRQLDDADYGRTSKVTHWTALEQHAVGRPGAELNYVEQGVGSDTVLLLHGLGNSWHIWLPLMEQLAQTTRVVAVDLPGFGQSDAPADGLKLEAIARVLEDAWPALELGSSITRRTLAWWSRRMCACGSRARADEIRRGSRWDARGAAGTRQSSSRAHGY